MTVGDGLILDDDHLTSPDQRVLSQASDRRKERCAVPSRDW